MNPTSVPAPRITMKFFLPAIAFWSFLTAIIPRVSAAEISPEKHFDQAIAPILVQRCLDCHSGAAPKGKLDLSSAASVLKGGKGGPAVVPKNPEKSPLWERVEAGEMPPKKPLPDAEKKLLR